TAIRTAKAVRHTQLSHQPHTRQSHQRHTRQSHQRDTRQSHQGADLPSPALACVAIAISGLSALVYEVAWTRLLALVIGPTTYAFSTMAAAFVTGLAIGSGAATPIARRSTRPAVWLAAAMMAGAIASMAAAWYVAVRLPLAVAAEGAHPGASPGS